MNKLEYELIDTVDSRALLWQLSAHHLLTVWLVVFAAAAAS